MVDLLRSGKDGTGERVTEQPTPVSGDPVSSPPSRETPGAHSTSRTFVGVVRPHSPRPVPTS